MSLTDGLLGVVQRLSSAVRELDVRVPSAPVWATVTQSTPLRVRPDGADDPLEATPENLTGTLLVPGARVLVQVHGRRVLVYGPGSNVAQHSTPGVNGGRFYVGDPTSTDAGYFVTQRLNEPDGLVVNGVEVGVDGNADQPVAALRTTRDGALASRLLLYGDGQVTINTNAASSTPQAYRYQPFATAVGTVALASVGASVVSATVTFPSARFTQAPAVTVTVQTSAPHVFSVSHAFVSTTGFTVYLYRTSGSGSVPVDWQAVQMRTGATSG